jgi:hypothetical protein
MEIGGGVSWGPEVFGVMRLSNAVGIVRIHFGLWAQGAAEVFTGNAFGRTSAEVGVDHVSDFAGEMGHDGGAEVGAFGFCEGFG